jgi:hypothetical protein
MNILLRRLGSLAFMPGAQTPLVQRTAGVVVPPASVIR